MRKNSYDATCARLEKQGWTLDRTALCKYYASSGAITAMDPKDGFAFCRVHVGKCHGVWKNGYLFSLQETMVYRKPLEA